MSVPAQEAGVAEPQWDEVDSVPVSETEAAPAKKSGKGKKAALKKDKGRKASSTRSSKATIVTSGLEPANDEVEDLARDEREIEEELARIATEQQQTLQDEQEKIEEFEPSPSHALRHAQQIHELERELHAEANIIPDPSVGMANYIATVAASPLPHKALVMVSKESATPSPSGSDKENLPSSVAPLSAKPVPLSLIHI